MPSQFDNSLTFIMVQQFHVELLYDVFICYSGIFLSITIAKTLICDPSIVHMM